MKTRFTTLFLLAILATAPLCVAGKSAFAGSGEGGGGGDSKNGGGDDDDSGSDGDVNSGGGGTGTGGGSGSIGSTQNTTSNSKLNDSDFVLNAVLRGQAVSMRVLFNFIAATYSGTVINVDLHKQGNGFIYRIKLLTADNRLQILRLDAVKLTDQNTASIY